MSELNIIRLQHGQSNTAANNFTTTAEAANGTMKLLARGNPGATTQDIITVDASGVVDHPQGLKIAGTSGQRMMLTAAKATTSGTSIDFSPADGTGIPSWAKRVTVLFNGVSTNGTSRVLIQLGTSSGLVTAGYASNSSYAGGTNAAGYATFTTGFGTIAAVAAATRVGAFEFLAQGSNAWVGKGQHFDSTTQDATYQSLGSITLSGALDRIRLTTVNGTDTFDAGSVSLLIEGY